MEHDRILGYFLEEASEHLNTIEQGLLKLPETVRQPAAIRELFRAAHSIKGSAAMLGLTDVQQVGNQFEANFKLLKEQPQIAVDPQLQSLFLESFAFLRAGINDVRVSKDPYRRDPATPDPVGDPVFEELKSYLQHLLAQVSLGSSEPTVQQQQLGSDTSVEKVFGEYVTRKLEEVSNLCLQLDSLDRRAEIQKICQKLGNLGENFEFLEWTNLFTACRLAIANPQNSLTQLGESIHLAVKTAQILVLANRHQEIEIPPHLTALIDRQHQSTQSVTDTLSTVKLDLPNDRDKTTDTLTLPPTAATEQLPVSSQRLNQFFSPTANLISSFDPSNHLVDFMAGNGPDFELGSLDSHEYMNSFGDDIPSDGTWMTDDDLLDTGMLLDDGQESATDQFYQQIFAPVTPQHPVSPVSDLTNPITPSTDPVEYDEETFYNPDLEGLDEHDLIPNFWSDTQLAQQSVPIYSDPDQPNHAGYQFQPEATPQIDLAISVPDFSLDRPMSELFPSVTTPEDLSGLTEAPQISPELVDFEAAATNRDVTFQLDLPTDTQTLPFNLSGDLAPVRDREFGNSLDRPDFQSHDIPETNGINSSSDALSLEELNDHNFSETDVSENTFSAELTNWIEDSLDRHDASNFEEVNLDILNSIDLDPDLLFTTNLSDVQLNISGDREFNENNYQAHGITDLDRDFASSLAQVPDSLISGDIEFSTTDPSLTDLDLEGINYSSDNLLALNVSSSDDLADLGIEIPEVSVQSIPHSIDNDLADLELNISRDVELSSHSAIEHIAEVPVQSIAHSIDNDLADLELNISRDVELSSHSAIDNGLSDLNLDLGNYSEQATGFLVDDLDLNIDSHHEPNVNQLDGNNLDLDLIGVNLLSDGDLDLLNNIEQTTQGLGIIPTLEPDDNLLHHDLLQLDSSVVTDVENVVKTPPIEPILAPDLHNLEQVENFDDLSEINFNLGEISTDANYEFADLDAILASNSSSQIDELGDLDALLAVGGAVVADRGEFDDLDALIGTPASPADAAINLDDLDLLLTTPTPVVQTHQAQPEIKPPGDRRSKQRTFEQTMRVSVRHLDNLNNLVGELVVNRNTLEQDQNRMRQFIEKLLSEVQKLNEVGKRMQDLYERSLMENSLVASRQQSKPTAPPPPSQIDNLDRNSTEIEYDPLEMDRFTPIHLLSQKMIELTVRIRESTADIEFVVDGSTEVTRTLRQITGQLQEDLTKSRMVPFAQTADRLQRGVRDNGLKYGKQVELSVEGRDTLIDKVILESLTDPLIHMVNNGIAHGIESAEIRVANGKPPEGKITIRAIHQGNQTIISISDDGAGINTERVKAKAIEKGIITAQKALTMTKPEVYELLFLPSFSTKDQADELAGRGVGMDVVRTSLTEIRGTITTESQLGVGTTFTIRLPLALSIAKALIAVNNKVNIAFPMDGVEDTQNVSPEQIQTNSNGEQCIFWRDGLMPFKPLSDLLGFNRPLSRNNFYNTQDDDNDLVAILILRSDGNLMAVQVDKIAGDQEIVIKPLQGPAAKPLGIAGATVLGDGRIVPIADVMELIALAKGTLTRHVSTQWATQMSIPTVELPESMVLIVDDSITVRELLSLTFKRAGYRVEQARDGQEAWDKLRAGLPCDIVFCDIEMPRMDGLEFLSRIQKDAALKKVPVAMLTSRGSDRHRQIAAQLGASGYFIKPYLEEALLDAAKRMIKGEVLAIV